MVFHRQHRKPSQTASNYEKTLKFANERHIKWELHYDDIEKMLQRPCFMCGEDRLERIITRIEPLEAFRPYNVAPSCWACVKFRGSMPLVTLLEQASKWIANSENIVKTLSEVVQEQIAQRERRALAFKDDGALAPLRSAAGPKP